MEPTASPSIMMFLSNTTTTFAPTTFAPTFAPSEQHLTPAESERVATPQFIVMILLTFGSMMLSGSSLEWVTSRGVFSKGLRNPKNTYNIIVFLAGTFSAIQAVSNFMLYYYEPTQVWFLFFCLGQWIVMTHTSVMLVSNRLSMLYRDSKRVWRQLLWINVCMAPISILVFVSWGGDKLVGSPTYAQMNRIIEPIQIALWGLIEFVLSGMFIVKMWHYKWTSMERKAIFMLILVGLCDMSTVFANILIGDLPSTVVKSFAYCLRIRLEVNVLCILVDYLKAKTGRGSRVSGLGNVSGFAHPNGLGSLHHLGAGSSGGGGGGGGNGGAISGILRSGASQSLGGLTTTYSSNVMDESELLGVSQHHEEQAGSNTPSTSTRIVRTVSLSEDGTAMVSDIPQQQQQEGPPQEQAQSKTSHDDDDDEDNKDEDGGDIETNSNPTTTGSNTSSTNRML